MKIYAVGGAVRDVLLGLPAKDHDYVVVGSDAEEMLRLGFRPVGKDFPVFLHPQSNEEYALARTERKSGRGYTGFEVHAAPEVTLEEDLARRDLSINALARDEHGALIDPYGGLEDLRAGILRHVSPAFVEDPVRILRVARFAARFAFQVAPETMALMREMVANGEVDALVAERVWQEFAKGLMAAQPARMFEVLQDCDALLRVLPEWAELEQPRALAALSLAARAQASLPVRYASLFAHAPLSVAEAANRRLRAPSECMELAALAARYAPDIAQAATLDAPTLVDLLQHSDALRRPERFAELLRVCAFDSEAAAQTSYAQQHQRLNAALAAARGVDAGAIARMQPKQIAQAVRAARVEAVHGLLSASPR